MAFNLLKYWEHYNNIINEGEFILLNRLGYQYYFKKRRGDQPCYTMDVVEQGYHLHLSYYVGVDWIEENETALYVAPKLNTRTSEISQHLNPVNSIETDYIKMLFDAIKHPEISVEVDELFEIKWTQSEIPIDQKQDLLTPLLVIQFLGLLRRIVRKGLKKSYYKVEANLYGKIKGKILSDKTIKQNQLKNKTLNTYCSYEEFGFNGLENRLLKRALIFVQRYLAGYNQVQFNLIARDFFNYVNPAFEMISEEVQLNDLKFTKTNAFYKEYQETIRLAKLILKRFGYNISNTEKETISTPPFWIDMSKLFELYVLGLLKDKFAGQGKLNYHFYAHGSELDYILNTPEYQMVADAKYKEIYQSRFDNEDIRQVSGYSRLIPVYEELKKPLYEIVDCLVIYPDQENGLSDLLTVDLKQNSIKEFVQFYKVGIRLPTIKS